MLTISSSAVDIVVFQRATPYPLFLVLQAALEGQGASEWGVMTGVIDGEESIVATAARTVQAHTGLQPIGAWALDCLHSSFNAATNQVCMLPILAIEVGDGKTKLSPAYAAGRWLPYEQSLELLRRHAYREAISRVQEDIVIARDRGGPFRVRL